MKNFIEMVMLWINNDYKKKRKKFFRLVFGGYVLIVLLCYFLYMNGWVFPFELTLGKSLKFYIINDRFRLYILDFYLSFFCDYKCADLLQYLIIPFIICGWRVSLLLFIFMLFQIRKNFFIFLVYLVWFVLFFFDILKISKNFSGLEGLCFDLVIFFFVYFISNNIHLFFVEQRDWSIDWFKIKNDLNSYWLIIVCLIYYYSGIITMFFIKNEIFISFISAKSGYLVELLKYGYGYALVGTIVFFFIIFCYLIHFFLFYLYIKILLFHIKKHPIEESHYIWVMCGFMSFPFFIYYNVWWFCVVLTYCFNYHTVFFFFYITYWLYIYLFFFFLSECDFHLHGKVTFY